MPDGAWLSGLEQGKLLSADELLTLVREVFIPLGLSRFRLTGGEPLLRPDLEQMIAALVELPAVKDVAKAAAMDVHRGARRHRGRGSATARVEHIS